MKEPGQPLQQVSFEQVPVANVLEEAPPIDPDFQDPKEEIIVLGGEEDAPTEPAPIEEEVTESPSVEPEEKEPPEEKAVPETVSPVKPLFSRTPARVKDGWMPTLVTTLTSSPTPRAVLAMPNGEEIVVRAGDLLAEEGVVVMSIGEKSVSLATISAEGGQAKVENITLASHYPEQ